RDEAGHEDTAVVYYEPAGASRAPDDAIVRELVSSNPASPAWFIDQPAQDQWPFYFEMDGTADNTFDVLPASVRGAGWTATRRLSRREARTDLAFRGAPGSPGATVYVMGADAPALAAALEGAGFRDTGERGRWHDDALSLVPFRLYTRTARAGERVTVP